MRTAVLVEELSPSDISNNLLYSEYEKKLEKDINKFFIEPNCLKAVTCPGCGKDEIIYRYNKMQMGFNVCGNCGSHFVSPRPTSDLLKNFYKHSEACIFWREKSLSLPSEKLYKLHNPRVQWILDFEDMTGDNPKIIMDFETKYPFFIEALEKKHLFEEILIYNSMVFEKNNLLPENIKFQDDLVCYKGNIAALTAFEALERMVNPNKLFEIASDCCRKGGLLLITTASCSGFEYQTLGANAPKINPINRMNLLSMEALKNKFDIFGFEIVELSTPGRLDVETVRRAFLEGNGTALHPFWKYIFEYRDESTWYDLQTFLQQHCLSSHVRIAAKKR